MSVLLYLLSGAGILITALMFLEWCYEPGEFDPDNELYWRGFEHGRRGYQRDVDNREAYNDGYSDGIKAQVTSEAHIQQEM
jgi:hypothetical protein